jgi:glutamate/tyrosine decarboxylase-like PLP-dependent enzyme
MQTQDNDIFNKLSLEIAQLHTSPPPLSVLPPATLLSNARSKLHSTIPTTGVGLEETIRHLQSDLAPAFNASSRSPHYYGFVTGGVTPAAALADNLVTLHDQNVQVHLPDETIATDVEDAALRLLCELLDFEPARWPHRTFTTGATASNILGLACGREYVIAQACAHRTSAPPSVGEIGLLSALRLACINEIQILTTVPHSSLSKAASLLGLGRSSIVSIGLPSTPHKFNLPLLKQHLSKPATASIVVISAAEVNTGLFATSTAQEMTYIRQLCDTYGAWLHVDAAFGILARILPPTSQYAGIRESSTALHLADSITGDAHKLLNVPYDCGFFLSRHLPIASAVFQNPNAAYLAPAAGTVGTETEGRIMSPLNIGIENSRRFRALPVYAALVAYGKEGYRDMLHRQVQLCRGIAACILGSEAFELLPVVKGEREREREEGGKQQGEGKQEEQLKQILNTIYIIVLFRARDPEVNSKLVAQIKQTRKIYVSGTTWEGRPACRFAVSNWQVDVQRDLKIVTRVLEDVALGRETAW